MTRLVKSAHNRLGPLVTRARGVAKVALMPGAIRGGRGLRVGRNAEIIVYGDLEIGEDVTLSDGCALQVSPGARLVIGDRAFVGRYSVVVSVELIEIGADTLIAEHCSIRDQNHHLVAEERLREVTALTAPVRIGPKVWIGAGVRVLKGAQIGEGVIIGANAVVTGVIPDRVIAGGIPARVLRAVGETQESVAERRLAP